MATGSGSGQLDIVVPVHDRAHSLHAVERLVGLASPRAHVHLVDDGSTDGTGAALDALLCPHVTVQHRPNGGPGAARNTGASRGSAPWIGFVDVDDVPDQGWVEQLLAHTHGAGIVGCGGRFARLGQLEVRTPTPLGPEFAGARIIFLPGLFIVRRDVFEAVGGYDERFRYSENTELGLRLTHEVVRRGQRIASTDDVLVTVHLPSSGRSNAYSSEARLQSALLMLEKHRDRLSASSRHLASYEAIAGLESLRLGHHAAARSHLRAAVRLRPSSARYWRHLFRALAAPRARRVTP